MPEHYQDASDIVRNIADLGESFEVVQEQGKFRIVRLDPPFYAGSEYWVVNEKGFLWEPASSLNEAQAYLRSDEASRYQNSSHLKPEP